MSRIVPERPQVAEPEPWSWLTVLGCLLIGAGLGWRPESFFLFLGLLFGGALCLGLSAAAARRRMLATGKTGLEQEARGQVLR